MAIYPLGISRSRDVTSEPKTEPGSPEIRWRRDGDLACAFIDAPHGALRPMHYTSALETIHRQANVLPMQYGAEAKTEAELDNMLQARQRELMDRLVRLDGSCEMSVRIYPPSIGPSVKEQHRPSKKTKQEDDATEEERLFVQEFIERLQGLYRDWRRQESTSSEEIRLAFLVQRDRVVSFRSRATSTLNACNRRCSVILGPWPPYSFV